MLDFWFFLNNTIRTIICYKVNENHFDLDMIVRFPKKKLETTRKRFDDMTSIL